MRFSSSSLIFFSTVAAGSGLLDFGAGLGVLTIHQAAVATPQKSSVTATPTYRPLRKLMVRVSPVVDRDGAGRMVRASRRRVRGQAGGRADPAGAPPRSLRFPRDRDFPLRRPFSAAQS